MKNTHQETARILRAAYMAWLNGGELRRSRNRNKNFTYGNQWNDYTTDIDGNPITEYRKLKEAGKDPITNNMMRQMVKNVVGRFRHNIKESSEKSNKLNNVHKFNSIDELDSRCLEEFLISGCCIQRIGHDHRNSGNIRVDNVNVNRFFLECHSRSSCMGL